MSSSEKLFTFLAVVAFLCFATVVTLQVLEFMYFDGSGAFDQLPSVWATGS